MRWYAELRKVEDQDDGTIKVWGIASAPTMDRAGETVLSKAVEDALPGFFAHGTGALREMHQLSAVGTVDDATVDENGYTKIEATVVDSEAIKKVQKGVYKGFSIGGKTLARDTKNPKVITKIALNEISLVDRPANPESVLTLWKADEADEERSEDMPTEAQEDINKTDAGDAAADQTPEGTVVPDAEPVDPTPDAAPVDPVAKAEASLALLESAVQKAEVAEDLAKGMHSVSRFADLLSSISYLLSDCQSEADYEKDGSQVPAALRGWLTQGAAIFKSMAIEEIDELVTSVTTMKKADESTTITANLEVDSAAVQEALGKAEQTIESLTKTIADRDEALSKISERIDPLVQKVETLTERLSKMEDLAVPPRTAGALAKAEPISKEQDSAGLQKADTLQLTVEQAQEVLSGMPEDERALIITKAALARPFSVSTR